MEFRHLRYFLALADELHFGRAAQRLSISQPPLSLNIQQLEASVGARLFDRDSRGVRLTAAGQTFRQLAQDLLAQAVKARQVTRDVANGSESRMRFGMVDSIVFRGLPYWLEAFRLRHRQVEVSSCECNSAEQIELLLRDEIALGFVQTRQVPPALKALLLYEEEWVCCVHDDHRLAAEAAISLHDLREEHWVAVTPDRAPDYQGRLVEMTAEYGFKPQVRYHMRNWLSVISLVSQRMGIAIVPASLRQSTLAGASFRPLAEVTKGSEVLCIWKPGTDNPWRDAFLDIIRP